jgi:hypothetical protein
MSEPDIIEELATEIIKRSKELNLSPKEVAETFFQVMYRLGWEHGFKENSNSTAPIYG